MRFQDPQIIKRQDVARPYWYIRPTVPVVTGNNVTRRQRSFRLGNCSDTTLAEAKRRKQEIMAGINQGLTVISGQMTFEALVERYRSARLLQLNNSTQAKYAQHLTHHILPAFGSLKLYEIDRALVEQWLQEKASKLSWWTRSDLRNILSAIFTAAIEWKLWKENPCTGVRLGRQEEKREKKLLTPEALRHFLHHCDERLRMILFIILATGLRVSEVLALKPSDFSPDGYVEVRRRWYRGSIGPPKTPRSRRRRYLGFQIPASGDQYLFTSHDGLPPDDREVTKELRRVAERTGVYFPGFGWRTFRRTNITWRQEAGATPFEAMQAAGHTRPDTTWLYTIADGDREKKHVEAIFEKLEGEKKCQIQTNPLNVQKIEDNSLSSQTTRSKSLKPTYDPPKPSNELPSTLEVSALNSNTLLTDLPISNAIKNAISPGTSSPTLRAPPQTLENTGRPGWTRTSDLYRVKVDGVRGLEEVLLASIVLFPGESVRKWDGDRNCSSI